MNMDDEDLKQEIGKRPPFAKPVYKGLGKVGAGDGYSGQEYDSVGQDDWRKRQEDISLEEDDASTADPASAHRG